MSRTTGVPDPERGVALDHRIESAGESRACTIFPRGADADELVTTWITAEDDAFVALEDVR